MLAIAGAWVLGGCVGGPHFGDAQGWSDSQKREFETILSEDRYASLCQLKPLYERYKKTHDTRILSRILVGYAENLENSCIDIPAYKRIEKARNDRKIRSHYQFYTKSVSASSVLGALRNGEDIDTILRKHLPANPQFSRLLRYYHSSLSADRKHKVFMSLQRAKVMSDEGWDTYFLVNIPEYKVRFFENGSLRFGFPVVVGKRNWNTPVFMAYMKYVVLNPTWNVPDNIARAEEIPHLLRDPRFLKRKHMVVLRNYDVDGKPIDPRTVPWRKYLSEEYKNKELPYKLIQLPSKSNALGRVKFMFPNPYSVYMHDTNARSLFKRSSRAYSHGCVRLSRPMTMLEYLARHGYLNDDWPTVQKKLASMKLHTVGLRKPIPVHVAYLTAYVDEDGSIRFFPDVYGFDRIMPLKKGR
ncbi:L,D-transpeptidase family protein [Nitratifractor sp.]